MESVFHVDRVSVEEDRKVCVMDDDGCTTMWMYLVLQNCVSKNGSNG